MAQGLIADQCAVETHARDVRIFGQDSLETHTYDVNVFGQPKRETQEQGANIFGQLGIETQNLSAELNASRRMLPNEGVLDICHRNSVTH